MGATAEESADRSTRKVLRLEARNSLNIIFIVKVTIIAGENSMYESFFSMKFTCADIVLYRTKTKNQFNLKF